MNYEKKINIRWSDLDPNFHLRHSAYYDFGAQFRIELLHELGLTIQVMKKEHFGPILFREECTFRREIGHGDIITLTAKITKLIKDGSRWSIAHDFINADGLVCAQINVDGAWMDTILRKLANPTPQIAIDVLNALPKEDPYAL